MISGEIAISLDCTLLVTCQIIDGRIVDRCTRFCDNQSESLAIYDAIEEAIGYGKNSTNALLPSTRQMVGISWVIT
jgi:hypothetical protein